MKILITGATSGIGKELALELLRNDENILYLVARRLDKLNEIYGVYGNRCVLIDADLSVLHKIGVIFDRISGSKLDGMVHCAGVSLLMKVAENDVLSMLDTFNVNYFSFIELCKYFYNSQHSNNGASIVAMSSIAASAVPYRQAIYSSSKAALEQSIRCIAKEFLPRRIRVNGIAAGAVETEMFNKLENNSDNLRLRMENYYPLGIINPNKIVKTIIYLLSDDSEHVDGTIIRYDSGFMINR